MRRSEIASPMEQIIKPFLSPYAKKREFRAFLFGSRAKGEAIQSSDRDIGILAKKKLNVKQIHTLQMMFDKTPYRVDIVDFSKGASTFHRLAQQTTLPIL